MNIKSVYLKQLQRTKCPICNDGELFVDEHLIKIYCKNRNCNYTSADLYEVIEDSGTTIEDVRVCGICGELMREGFYCEGDYYCSKECMDNDPNYSYKQYLEDYDKGDDVYWTQWY